VSALVAPATVVLNTATVSSPVDDFNLSNNSYTLGLFVQQIQNISFQAPSNQQLGAQPVSVSATANSGLAVSFNSQTSAVCAVSGTAVTLLAVGTCTIQAIQGGNFEYAAANPVSQSFQVLAPATTTSLSVLPSPAVFGSKVTLKATVSLPSATGTVTFYNGGVIVGVEPVSGGVATLNTTLLPFGVSTLSARYVGGGANPGASSLSATQPETVNAGVVDAYSAASGSPIGVGTFPVWVAVADFNNDGIQDLAVINQSNNNVSILLGNGSGGFTASGTSPFATGTHPTSLATGDFNGDGNTDLAITNSIDDTVTILLGNGSGGFTAASGGPFAVGHAPNSIAVADFNGDGYADLAVANSADITVTLLLGNGNGGFAPAGGSPFTLGSRPTYLIAGDFNNDGNADLAVASFFGNNVSILLGNGNAGFSTPSGSPITVGHGPSGLAMGDFNGDGKPDLAVANNTDNDMSILQGNGDGTFNSLATVPVSAHPVSVAVGDLNGDGKADLAVTGQSATKNLTVLFGNGSGGFTAANPTPFTAGMTAQCVAIGDFNGDGKADLAIANSGSNNVTVLLGVDNPTQLKITQAPSNGTAGVPLGNVVVQVEDAAGNLMTGSTAAITMASTPAGVNGTLTVNAQGGVATFSSLVFYSPHTYTLSASATGLVSALTSVVVAASPSGTPGIVSASPNAATGSTNTFTLAYSDTGGNASLTQVGVTFGPVANSANSCLVWYHPATNLLFLENNAGTASTQITLGSGTLSNSQCSINGSASSVARSGQDLTLTLSVTASSTYTGKQSIFMYATDSSSVSTPWVNEGTWTPAANQPPALVSVSENPPSSLSTTFTLTYSDPNGATDLNTVRVILGSSVTTVNTCYAWYVAATNLVYLENNAGTGTTTLTPGSGTLSNSQCSISGSGTSVQRSGDNLVLTLAVTVTSAATKNVYMNAMDNSAAVAAWTKMGTWTP